jgi:hypothetical protein
MKPVPVTVLWLALLAVGPLACGPIESTDEPSPASSASQELESDNGLMANGLSANGLSANGLSANGLSANGLSANGLSAPSFSTWFGQNPAQGDMVMRYIVRCAVPASQVRTYTDAQRQITYSWQGGLGLAPGWSSGQSATVAEQQVVSACLAAHVNKFGVPVSISVLGQNALGQWLPVTGEEAQQYTRREACYFGNLFTGQGVFFGSEGPRLGAHESSSRACALSSADPATANACPPLVYAGACQAICQQFGNSRLYTSCTRSGVTYKALAIRIRPSEIYECGDHICQVSEQCCTGRGSGCDKDCGRCPSSME